MILACTSAEYMIHNGFENSCVPAALSAITPRSALEWATDIRNGVGTSVRDPHAFRSRGCTEEQFIPLIQLFFPRATYRYFFLPIPLHLACRLTKGKPALATVWADPPKVRHAIALEGFIVADCNIPTPQWWADWLYEWDRLKLVPDRKGNVYGLIILE